MRLSIHIAICFSLVICSCSADQKKDLTPFQKHQKEQQEFMLSEDSPIEKSERKNFISLNYFNQDSTYVFNANYESIFNGSIIEFATNTDRKPVYIHTANVTFTLEKSLLTLKAYRAQNSTDSSLFVPFNDLTNGVETYKSGRYLNLYIPDNGAIVVDFNLAYNPYCAYNKKYSCPIPPVENRLNVKIKAGEKKYH